MSKMQITATTDGRYIGHVFDEHDNPIALGDDVFIYIDRTMTLPEGVRYITSSYSIDAVSTGD